MKKKQYLPRADRANHTRFTASSQIDVADEYRNIFGNRKTKHQNACLDAALICLVIVAGLIAYYWKF